jgi:DNA-binding transcriptional ArsR family regulator/catechol 2,3-dioxygenase-like lactoylglutathione lyase family enzyme
VSDIYRAIADPTRRALLDELTATDGQTLFALCTRLTTRGVHLTRQALSQHLAVLEDAGLVHVRREGRYKFHDIDTRPLREIAQRWPVSPDRPSGAGMPTIAYCSVFVDDQEKALHFYTDVLGFVLKHDVPLGEARWLTVTAPGDPDGTELLLEPDGHPAVEPYRSALVEDGIPVTAFGVEDVVAEVNRLHEQHGVRVVQQPVTMGPRTIAVIDDTCGNLIQLFSEVGA